MAQNCNSKIAQNGSRGCSDQICGKVQKGHPAHIGLRNSFFWGSHLLRQFNKERAKFCGNFSTIPVFMDTLDKDAYWRV